MRQIIAKIGFIIFLIPGILFLIIEFSNKLGQSNPFIIAMIFIGGGIVGLIGFISFIIADKGLKKINFKHFGCCILRWATTYYMGS